LKSEENKKVEVRKMEERMLREVTVKIGLERIDIQKGIIVETLLDSGTTGLVISLEFTKKQDFKLKKLERPCKEYRWVAEQGRTHSVMGCLNTNNFYFLLFF